jgi:hydrogenase maturation factor HypF (carbamoyltransferase family)
MSSDRSGSARDLVVCVACCRQLQPEMYTRSTHGRKGHHSYPQLKCAECGRRYEWRVSIGWVPFDSDSNRRLAVGPVDSAYPGRASAGR